ELASLIGGKFATSGHPKNGKRSTPDELAEGGLQSLIVAKGAEPCRWTKQFQEANDYIHAPPSLLSNADETGFAAELPWGDFSSLCQFKGDEFHPYYGHGLLLRQSFPVSIGAELEGIKLALELNAQQLDQKPDGYGLGSYCYDRRCLAFVGFFPNLIYNFAWLKNLYFSSSSR